MTQEAYSIAYFKNVRPEQVVTDILGPDSVTDEDLRTIETLRQNYKLTGEVINVLFHCVLFKTNVRPERAYIEKIASHWARKRIKTAEQAVELARKEQQHYDQWRQGKQQTPVQRAKLSAIQEAINSGLSDEQLGAFVRNLFRQ
ncbi:DnaD domain protein [Pseudobacillus sp. FSL P4-0506]|uniref:DnaD domain protein n=1 Tax=Pseudobacillus sp. FSL P4-0506 TaxID=2921576 RepID=UPI0030FB2A30